MISLGGQNGQLHFSDEDTETQRSSQSSKVDLVAYKGTGEHLGHRVANFEGQGRDLSRALGDSLQEPRSQQGDTVSDPGGEMQPEQPRET